MGIFKENAVGGQAVRIRDKGLRVSTHATDPIFQIVDCDKKKVGLGFAQNGRRTDLGGNGT